MSLFLCLPGYLLSPTHLQLSIPGLPRCFAAWGPSLGSCCATALPGRRLRSLSLCARRKCIRKRIMIVDRILCEYISLYMWIDYDEYNNDIFVLIHHYSEHMVCLIARGMPCVLAFLIVRTLIFSPDLLVPHVEKVNLKISYLVGV